MRERTLTKVRVWAVLALGCLSMTACVTAPYHNQVIASPSTPISVQAFTVMKESPIEVQCRPYLTGGAWTTIATLTSSASALTAEQGDLYSAGRSVVVPTSCWYHWHSQYTTELRFMGGPYTDTGGKQPLAVYDQAGVSCVFEAFGEGVDYATMSNDCRLKTTSGSSAQSIYVHAND
jgi:hypothetical protein